MFADQTGMCIANRLNDGQTFVKYFRSGLFASNPLRPADGHD
ncbi:MAG TPA: hypothetical protein VNB22_09260 [Pyrinomonadaceae bacterium]|nr:hypothetical protein [Pyrinomonadaceae bacterium]